MGSCSQVKGDGLAFLHLVSGLYQQQLRGVKSWQSRRNFGPIAVLDTRFPCRGDSIVYLALDSWLNRKDWGWQCVRRLLVAWHCFVEPISGDLCFESRFEMFAGLIVHLHQGLTGPVLNGFAHYLILPPIQDMPRPQD